MFAYLSFDSKSQKKEFNWVHECFESTLAYSDPLCSFPKKFHWKIDLFKKFKKVDEEEKKYENCLEYDKENKVMTFLIKQHWINSYMQIATRTCKTTEEIFTMRYTFAELQRMGEWYAPLPTPILIEESNRYERECGICFYGREPLQHILWHYPIINESKKTWMKIGSTCIEKFDYSHFSDSLTGEYDIRKNLPYQDKSDLIASNKARKLKLNLYDYTKLFNFFVESTNLFTEEDLRLIFFANSSLSLVSIDMFQLVEFYRVFEQAKKILPHMGDACYLEKKEKEKKLNKKLTCVFIFDFKYDSIHAQHWNFFYDYVAEVKNFYFIIWRTVEKVLTTKRSIGLDFLQIEDLYKQIAHKKYLFDLSLLT